ncbi:hypothetical protein BBJ28_00025316 [Nothophytophthora sp. Chile5]|nr:hypothetical protein BBJ28_00025316 [Nothophytophthora sp. Chile5]
MNVIKRGRSSDGARVNAMDNDLVFATTGALLWTTSNDPELMAAVIAAMVKKTMEERTSVPDVRFNTDNTSNVEAVLKLRFTGAAWRLLFAFWM